MAIIVPNSASTLGSAGGVPSSCNAWVWLGFQTLTASGSVTWYQTTACISGCEIFSISLSPQQSVLFGPFSFSKGVYAAGVTGGCALVMLKLPNNTP